MNALHHEETDKSSAALLLIDMINPMDFDGGNALLKNALPMAERLADFKKRAAAAGIPVIYVNDNFGRWRSDFKRLVDCCIRDGVVGRPVVERLQPAEEDFFVLKPKHSGFFASPLQTLLQYLEVKTTIITGMATDICVLFTANDAYMNDYNIIVPKDCVAAEQEQFHQEALNLMERALKADTTPSTEIDLSRLLKAP